MARRTKFTKCHVNWTPLEQKMYKGEWNENLKSIWCADPWLISRCAAISFTVTRRFSFTMALTAAMASDVTTRCAWPGRGEPVTELMPFMNFLVHSYTCCSDRHASPYWTFFRRWISMGFTPSLRCSSLVHVASGAATFTLLLRRRVAFLHRTATCRPLFKPWVSLLSTYKRIELCFEFLSHFYSFHLTLPRSKGSAVFGIRFCTLAGNV